MRRRLLQAALRAVLLLVGVTFLSFALAALAPGDLVDELRLDPQVSPETLARLRAQRGLDRPLLARYGTWLGSALRGELGRSDLYDEAVWTVLQPRTLSTVRLTLIATVIAWLLAVPIGALAAARRGRWVDRAVGAATAVPVAVPDLLIALAALWLAVGTGWFPAGGQSAAEADSLPMAARLRDAAWHLALPVTVLVIGILPVLVRHVRTAVLAALGSPALLAARARGVGELRLVARHALRLAAPSLAPLAGLAIAGLLSGSLAVEVVFGWPGLGPLLVEATLARDASLVVGAAAVVTALLVTGAVFADLAAWTLDPRSREDGAA